MADLISEKDMFLFNLASLGYVSEKTLCKLCRVRSAKQQNLWNAIYLILIRYILC